MKQTVPILALGLLILAGCGNDGQDAETRNAETGPQTVSVGQGLFLNHCVSCHRGGGNPPGPNSIILQSGQLSTEEGFRAFLRHPTTPMMPLFEADRLSNGDVHELFVYLQSARTSN